MPSSSSNQSAARHWCMTINNYPTDEETLKLMFEHPSIEYSIRGYEVAPTTNTPHLQCFVTFHSRQRLSALKKIFPTAHAEVKSQYSTIEQAVVYCKKSFTFVEHGTQPREKHAAGNESQILRYETAWNLAKKGKFEEIDADIRIRCYSTLKLVAKDFMQTPPDLTELDNHWFYGTTGVGKSVQARTLYPDAYYKPCTKWWDGYQDEETVIIEDFDKYNIKLGQDLKIWGDYGHFNAEIKGGALRIRPKRIIITSNWHPSEIWDDHQTLQPILRRYHITHMLASSNLVRE